MRSPTRKPTEKQAVAYIRCSTDRQELGPIAQRQKIERWAQINDVAIVSWHEETISGAEDPARREALIEALVSVELHPGAMLVLTTRDRLAREAFFAELIERQVRNVGGTIVTIDGVPLIDGPTGKFIRTVLDAAAEFERSIAISRIKAAQAIKWHRNECFGIAPYGMQRAADGRSLEWCPEELEVVDIVVSLFHEGWTYNSIATWLWKQGWRNRRGTKIVSASVRRIARNYEHAVRAGHEDAGA